MFARDCCATEPLNCAARSHAADRVIRRLHGADLDGGVARDLGAVTRVVEDAGEAGVDGVDVVAAVEVVIDVDLPVAGHLVFAPADEAQRFQPESGSAIRQSCSTGMYSVWEPSLPWWPYEARRLTQTLRRPARLAYRSRG